MSFKWSALGHWKLREKLIVSYLILIIIPIVTLGLYSYQSARSYLNEQARIGLKNTVDQMALTIDEKMAQPKNFMNFMSYNPTVKKVTGNDWGDDILNYTKELNENIEPTIWYYINFNREISDVVFYSEYISKQVGSFVYPSEAVKRLDWYQSAKNSNHVLWLCEEDHLFAVSKILKSDNNTFAGVVYLKLNYEKLFGDLKSGRPPQDGIFITDRDGNSIFSAPGGDSMSIKDLRIGMDDGQYQIALDGHAYVISQASIRNTGWVLHYSVPLKGFLVNTHSIIKATFTIVIACLFILILFIWLFSRTFVRPIYTLKRKIQIVENGDFDIPIVTSAKDEIAELTLSFAQMVHKVKQLIQELDQSRIKEKEAELTALQAQINPHFLYNALSTINWKAIQIDSPEISKIANSLSRFYRTSLNKGLRITSVREEIANIKAYLDIQLIMHNHEFDVSIDVQEQANPYATLNFILQPIVENAIIHGIDEREEGKGSLSISVTLESNIIRFIVTDNGKGMNQEMIDNLYVFNGGGYGLRNVHERIQLHYGDDFGAKVESEEGKYTKVIIEIPVNGY